MSNLHLLHFCLSIALPNASIMTELSTPSAKHCLDLALTATSALEQSLYAKCLSNDPLETTLAKKNTPCHALQAFYLADALPHQ